MHMPRNDPASASHLQRSGDGLRSLSNPETLANFAQNLQEGIYITTEVRYPMRTPRFSRYSAFPVLKR